jgi:hypothetical protein
MLSPKGFLPKKQADSSMMWSMLLHGPLIDEDERHNIVDAPVTLIFVA